MNRVCAWCGAILEAGDVYDGEDQEDLPITHGICEECLQDQLDRVYDGSMDLGGES